MASDNEEFNQFGLSSVEIEIHDELVNEVEVVSADVDQSGSEDVSGGVFGRFEVDESTSEDVSLSVAEEDEESTLSDASSSSVDTNPLPRYRNEIHLLAREIRALKEEVVDLMKRVQELLAQEVAWAAAHGVREVNSPPEAASLLPLTSNVAVKRKSTTSKYSKKKKLAIPGGATRVSRSLNVKQKTTLVGVANLSTSSYDDDDDFLD